MNFSPNEIILEAQRGRQWSPLITQQLRLRHINQIWCLNLKSENMKTGSFYLTLHLTSMSAPLYTSERAHGPHPKWMDLTLSKFPSASAVVLRIWRHQEDNDIIVLTWGLHLSGLVYIGNKVTDIQPSIFNSNTVIFYMFGGFFTSNNAIKDGIPKSLLEHSNIVDFPRNKCIFKRTTCVHSRGDIKRSYNVEKMRKLHYLQVMIKNKCLDVQHMQEKISELDVLLQKPEKSDVHYSPNKTAPQLLTMNCLNRMLQEKPTRVQKMEMFKLNKQIEIAKFRCRLLSQEHEKKLSSLRQLRTNYSVLVENNTERESALMESYHALSRETEKLKEYQKVVSQHRELLVHSSSQLQHRKRQLLQQLLWIYPIKEISDKKYTINNIYLPNADVLSDANDDGISVALGYVAHVLTMCSVFLQVPLRYPVNHYGSRSTIIDQISSNLPEKEFPLFTKGKDRMQFTYGVYLLNKNIAQLRWLYFMHTPDLKLILPNLLNFLQGYKEFKQERFLLLKSAPNSQTNLFENEEMKSSVERQQFLQKLPALSAYESCSHCSDPILDCLRQEKCCSRLESPSMKRRTNKDVKIKNGAQQACSGGLSEILAIPEAYLSRQLSGDSLKNYMSISDRESGDSVEKRRKIPKSPASSDWKNCDINLSTNTNSNLSEKSTLKQCDSVEEGTDLLNPKTELSDLLTDSEEKSENFEEISRNDEPVERNNLISKDQQEFMQHWLRTGPALVCSDKNLYPEEFLGSTSGATNAVESPLTARTDALLTTKSFNLVKPKH